jgi:hypothetical protein
MANSDEEIPRVTSLTRRRWFGFVSLPTVATTTLQRDDMSKRSVTTCQHSVFTPKWESFAR